MIEEIILNEATRIEVQYKDGQIFLYVQNTMGSTLVKLETHHLYLLKDSISAVANEVHARRFTNDANAIKCKDVGYVPLTAPMSEKQKRLIKDVSPKATFTNKGMSVVKEDHWAKIDGDEVYVLFRQDKHNTQYYLPDKNDETYNPQEEFMVWTDKLTNPLWVDRRELEII